MMRTDERGSIAIETALVLPVLILLALGFTDGAARWHETQRAERAAGEAMTRLLANPTQATSAAAAAGASLIAPGAAYRVDTVVVSWDAGVSPTVTAQGADGSLSVGAPVVPPALAKASATAVYARVTFQHTPLASFLPGAQTITATAVSWR